MRQNPAKSAERNALKRRLWKLVFCGSGTILVGCLVPIVGFPLASGFSHWIYLLAAASATVCAVAASQTGSLARLDATEDAAWLARMNKLNAREVGDGIEGGDD